MHVNWVTTEPGVLFVGAGPQYLITAVSLPHWLWVPRILSAESLGDDVYLQSVSYTWCPLSSDPRRVGTQTTGYRSSPAPETLTEFLLTGVKEQVVGDQYTGRTSYRVLTRALMLPKGRLPERIRPPLWTDSRCASGGACPELSVWGGLGDAARQLLEPRLLAVSRAIDPAPSLQAPAKFWQHLGRAKNRR